jgi:hypothetical protein
VVTEEATNNEGSEEEVSDEPIKHGLNKLVALCIDYDVRKPGMASAIAKIIDECTENRDEQIATFTRDLAAAREELAASNRNLTYAEESARVLLRNADKEIDGLRAQLAAANATVAQCKAAGFIDEQGNVVKVEKQYWRADTDGDCCEDLLDIADSCGDGEFIEVTPLLILPRELYVVQVKEDGTGSCREATPEEHAQHKKNEMEWRERAKVLPRTAAEAAREGKGEA